MAVQIDPKTGERIVAPQAGAAPAGTYDTGPLAGKPVPGLLQQGNIDVNHRPGIKNDDGSVSSIYSMTIPVDKQGNPWKGDYEKAPRYALVPSIADGKFLTPDGKIPKEGDKKANQALEDAATDYYAKTRQHLGVFASGDAADKYAGATHAYVNDGTPRKVYAPSYSGDSNISSSANATQAGPQIDPKTGERVTNAAPEPQGFFSSAADSSGLSGLAHAIAHPIDTITGIPGAIASGAKNALNEAHDEVNALRTNGLTQETRRKLGGDVPIIGPTLAKAQSQHDSGNDAGMAGTLAGTVLGAVAPTAAAKALKVAPEILRTAATAGQDTGVDMLNGIVGAGKNSFKRGANPAQGYLEAGGGPALSMKGLATKGTDVKAAVGSQIGDMRKAATKAGVLIPPQDVAGALNPAIAKGIDLEAGPGGGGNTASIENYSSTFRPTIKNAIANGGVSPDELGDLKSRISKNTGWSEPGQFNLKAIRQANTGALSDLENSAIPEIAPLKSQYQSLINFSKLAQSKADTGSLPLTALIKDKALSGVGTLAGAGLGYASHENPLLSGVVGGMAGLAANSIPVKSAIAAGLYRGGGALDSAAGLLDKPVSLLPSGEIAPYNLIANKNKKDK